MKKIKPESLVLLLGMSVLTIMLVVGANQAPESKNFNVDVTGCESQACEDMLEEIQAGQLVEAGFIIK